MEFILTHPDIGTKDILILFDGVPYEADSNHPWWDEIVDLAIEDDPRVLDLFPIRPVQEPSVEVEDEDFRYFNSWERKDEDCNNPDCWCHAETVPDEDGAAIALLAAFGDRDLFMEDLTEEDLRLIRTIFDQAGFDTCDDPDCKNCHGPRA